ncbi:energy transducer TonB [Holophaga foetida]|uniref:energy transducer TonB n=1 Tax=Holophaga foetida TaxID=35839 RepID=UPI000310DD2C|nr:energy transducer TonB [Holophaga foetida]
MTIAPSPQLQMMASSSIERVPVLSKTLACDRNPWKDAPSQEQMGEPLLMDAIYRPHLLADYQPPSRVYPTLAFGGALALLVGLGAIWPSVHEQHAPPKTVTIALGTTESPGSWEASPPQPPAAVAGGTAETVKAPQTPEEVPAPVQEAAPSDPIHFFPPEPARALGTPGVPGAPGSLPGGVPGGRQGGEKDATSGGDGHGFNISITPPKADATYLKNPHPIYPSFSRRAGETGTVRLRVLVGADGRVIQLEVQQSSGFSRLDQAAMEAVRRWIFLPARCGPEAVDAWVVVPLTFALDN